MATEKMCVCGKPLHYASPLSQKLVEDLIADLGECIDVVNMETGRMFRVPRHFIALHGFKAVDLPALAQQYGFEEVTHD